jgi:hypothetical protein
MQAAVATLDPEQTIIQIDAIIRQLTTLRHQLLPQVEPATTHVTEQLFGALGRGTWDEYEPNLDWIRFGEA